MEPTTAVNAAQAVEHANWIAKAFHDGGTAMIFIAMVGIGTLLLIVFRFLNMARMTIDKEDFNEKIFGMVLRGDINQAIAFCNSKPAPITNVLKAGLDQVRNKRPDEEVQVAMDSAVLRETPKIEGYTGFLAVFGNVATLIGLLGTIVGLILSFGSISAADPAEKANMLSRGISEALNCTAFGLIVAIPALVFYGYFQIRVQRLLNDMVESSMSLMNLVVANRDKIKE